MDSMHSIRSVGRPTKRFRPKQHDVETLDYHLDKWKEPIANKTQFVQVLHLKIS